MTDLDQNYRTDKACCCGSQLPHAPILRGVQRIENRYCSKFCYEQDVRATWVSAPVFDAPRPLNLRDHLLFELALNV